MPPPPSFLSLSLKLRPPRAGDGGGARSHRLTRVVGRSTDQRRVGSGTAASLRGSGARRAPARVEQGGGALSSGGAVQAQGAVPSPWGCLFPPLLPPPRARAAPAPRAHHPRLFPPASPARTPDGGDGARKERGGHHGCSGGFFKKRERGRGGAGLVAVGYSLLSLSLSTLSLKN